MTDKEKLNKKVSDNLAISFHEQFAKNQNHHQMLFLQVLGILLTVLVGFRRDQLVSCNIRVMVEEMSIYNNSYKTSGNL